MKCPVCENECGESSVCRQCGFNEVGACFLNKEDAEHWMQTVVLPYRNDLNEKDLFITSQIHYCKMAYEYDANGHYRGSKFLREVKALTEILPQKDYPTQLIIPEGVQIINPKVFSSICKMPDKWRTPNTEVNVINPPRTIKFPSTLIEILEGSFVGCHYIPRLDFSSIYNPSLIIPEFAFNMFSFKQILMPKAIKSIETAAFQQCNELDHIVIHECEEIKSRAFISCKKLRYVVIDSALTIYNEAFYGCSGLKHVFLGTNIGYLPTTFGNSRPQIHCPGEWEIVDGKIILKDKK